jgi:predicted anti-sigma-YlaC factor YlaD
MNNTSNCAVLRDLYPSYLNEELEEETVEWIMEHMKDCEDCRQWTENYKEETMPEEVDSSKDTPREEEETAVIKRARIFLIAGMAVVIALALWMSFWIVS